MTSDSGAVMPRARFFCRTGELAGTEHRIGAEATIGRDPECAIVLPAGVVSKRHARIVFDQKAGAYWLEDLRSRNGTRLDGKPVGDRSRLGDLHVIMIGERHDFFFVASSEHTPCATAEARVNATTSRPENATHPPPPASSPGSTDAPAADQAGTASETVFEAPSALRAPLLMESTTRDDPDSGGVELPENATALDAPSVVAVPALERHASVGAPDARHEASATVVDPLTLLSPPPLEDRPATSTNTPSVAVVVDSPSGARRRIELPDGRHIVGRGRHCAIRIDDSTLSREHAAFTVRNGTVTVEDLNSLNGTVVDGRAVQSSVAVALGRPVTFGGRATAIVVSTDRS